MKKKYFTFFAAALSCSLFAETALKQYNLIHGLPDIYITSETERIGHTWEQGHVWDKPLINEFYTVLNQHAGDFVMLDLGAQTGSFSLLAKFFPQSKWYAFEPLGEAADNLKANLLLNNIENVAVYQMAASNIPGYASLKMPDSKIWGLATLGDNVLRFSQIVETRRIECIDLDSFITSNNIPKVDFVKMDTEGWEYYILLGAKNMILRDRPVILMEYNETNMIQCDVKKHLLDELLQSLGYEWTLISSEDILCIPRRDD